VKLLVERHPSEERRGIRIVSGLGVELYLERSGCAQGRHLPAEAVVKAHDDGYGVDLRLADIHIG
jgi:hypothetical protein